MNKHTIQDLYMYQALPLDVKVEMTKSRIRGWVKEFGEEGVYVSFSGGKDSTVLLHLVREEYPNIPAVFVDVPTQYPELKQFAQTFDNVEILKPKMSFAQVCEKYGFPMFSKEISRTVYYAKKYYDKVKELDRRESARQNLNERTNESHNRCGTVCGSLGNRQESKKEKSSVANDKDGDYP